jgi:hypothetical protein
MWPFTKLKNSNTEIDKSAVNRPVENPALEAAMLRHTFSPSESTVNDMGRLLNSANFLIPIASGRMDLEQDTNQQTLIRPGSVIEFLLCQNTSGQYYLAAFTSWHELRQWAGNDAQAFVFVASDLWSHALNQSPNIAGVVINPANNPWTLHPENIKALMVYSS